MVIRRLQLYTKQQSVFLKKNPSSKHVHNLFDKNPHPSTTLSVNRSMLNSLQDNNTPLQTLTIFKTHLKHSFLNNVDEVTMALALKACRKDLKHGSEIHGFSITSGFVSFITVSNSVMNMYCKVGEFSKALSLFENLNYPDIVSWNTILSGFEKKSDDALRFALRMSLSGVVFDEVTYTKVLAYCLDYKGFVFGLQLHCLNMKSGLDCDVFVGNAFITMYSRWGLLIDARRVFDEMPLRDCVTWNAMLSGYTQEGNHGLEAIYLFTKMVKKRMKLDHVSYTSAVSACGHERNLELGRQIHGLCVKTGYENHVSVCNVLISTYSKCEVIEEANMVFKRMNERNVVSWTTMISMNEKDAISLFNDMRLDEVYPNEVTFVGLIHAVTIQNFVEEGRKIHGLCLKINFLLETNVCNSFITMYAKFKLMKEAENVFEEIKDKGIVSWNALISGYAQNEFWKPALRSFLLAITKCSPNEYTFGSVFNAIGGAKDISLKHGQRCHSHIIKLGLNYELVVSSALLDMYAKRGSISESENVFHEMPQMNRFGWTAMISAYTRHGDYESVMKWFNAMEMEDVKPDSITFLSVLTACGRKGMVDAGCRVFDSMIKDYHIEPSSEHYSCMVDMLGRAGRLDEAEGLMGRIPGGCRPGLSVLQSLLGACRVHGNVEMGERVAHALTKIEPMESGCYVLMSNLYAEKGEWGKVASVRKGMREKGVKKEVGFSWVDVVDTSSSSLCLHAFSSGDMSHAQSDEICRMVEFLGLEMKVLKHKERKMVHNRL